MVIFDLDGTLIDAYENLADSVNHALTQLGVPPQDVDTVRRTVGRGPRNLMKNFVQQKDLDRAEAIFRKRYRETLFNKTALLDGTHETLKALRAAGVKMAVASNKPGEFTRPLLEHLKIAGYFDCVVCGDEVESLKPHPETLLRIMRELKARADETVYVGDMALDVRTAKAAGVRPIAVATGSSSREELEAEKPLLIMDRLPELIALLPHAPDAA